MSPAQTSGRDSFGWRLRCPFRDLSTPRGGAEDSYGIEDRSSSKSSSKIKGKASGAEKGAGETEKRCESRICQGAAGQTGGKGSASCQACSRQARERQAAG